jgi:hypothetical protein
MRLSPWISPLALVAAAAVAAAKPPPPPPPPPPPIPPGPAVLPGAAAAPLVTDADGAKGFVVNPSGGVTGLDLAKGDVLWETKDPGRPLAVAGDRVLVQARDPKKANVVRVLGLKISDGTKAWESDPIELPDWAAAEPGNGAGRSFFSRAWSDKGAVLIAWQANTWYFGGAVPSPEILKASQHHADGVAKVDLDSGKVEMLEAAKAPAPPGEANVSKELQKEAGPNVAASGDYAVVVAVEPSGGKQKAVLKRWDLATEKPLDPVVLAEGATYQVVTLPAAGLALVREAAAGVPSGDELTWTAYGLATGRQTAKFNTEPAAGEFSVIGPRAYYVVQGPHTGPPFGGVIPRTLHAVDLKTGKRLWERPLEGERLPPPPPP